MFKSLRWYLLSSYISKWILGLNVPENLLVCIYYDLISSEIFNSLRWSLLAVTYIIKWALDSVSMPEYNIY